MGPVSISAAKQVATRNILNPLLWLCGIISAPAIPASAFATGSLQTILLVLALVPPTAALIAYAYWTFKEPNRLQSEQFVLEQQWMQSQAQIGDNRTQEVIDVPIKRSALTQNPVAEQESSQ